MNVNIRKIIVLGLFMTLAGARCWGAAAADVDMPLIRAAQQGSVEEVRNLLAAGVNVNLQDKNGDTALIWAAFANNDSILDLLLRVSGVDVNLQDKDGYTPLMAAAGVGNYLMVELLLGAAGVKVNLQDGNKNTALIVAVMKGYDNIVGLLLKAGARTDLKNTGGRNALDLAKMYQKDTIVEMLNKHMKEQAAKLTRGQQAEQSGAVPPVAGEHGEVGQREVVASDEAKGRAVAGSRFFIMRAIQAGNVEQVSQLLGDVDINGQDPDRKMTLLMIAVLANKIDIVRLLLANEVNVDLQDTEGYTALMLAEIEGYGDIVQLLLGAGASTDLTNDHGENVLDMARSHQKDTIVAMLNKHMKAQAAELTRGKQAERFGELPHVAGQPRAQVMPKPEEVMAAAGVKLSKLQDMLQKVVIISPSGSRVILP